MLRRVCFYWTPGAVLAGILLIGACATEKTNGTRHMERAAVHAVHTRHLQEVMGELGTTVQQEWPQEIQDLKRELAERERERHFEKASELARDLAKAAEAIPGAVSEAKMTPAQRRSFLDSAELLHDQALKLSDVAAREDLAGVRASLNQIRTTCYGCHTQFREYAGPIRFGKLD